MCLFCTSFLLPKCAHSSSNIAVNWGSGEELCDISTWKSPEVIILLSGPQFFSAVKQGSWTRKCLRSSFHNPITWAPPAVFESPPFCYQRSTPATLHAQSQALFQLSAFSNYWREIQVVHKMKKVGELFSRSIVVSISFIGYKGWRMGMEELQSADFSDKLAFFSPVDLSFSLFVWSWVASTNTTSLRRSGPQLHSDWGKEM